MEFTVFTEFGLLIGIATAFAIIATKLKQPAILGYIIAGLVIKSVIGVKVNPDEIELFATIGITLLLFVLGLELNINDLKKLGKVAIIAGIGQVIGSIILSFIVARLAGFSATAAFYIAIGLAFSSTIVVVKLLSAKKTLETLYGKISIGFLLIQDFIAIFIIIALSAIGNLKGNAEIGAIALELGLTLVKGILASIFIYIFVKAFLNPLINWIRNDKEVLFFTVIAWALLLAIIMGSKTIGFTPEIGGLIAGIALSNRFEHLQIESWTKPLRDFFLMMFFITLGLNIELSSISSVLWLSILISLFVLIAKPFITIILMKFAGYSKKVSLLTALSLAQISEFSLIVAKLGANDPKVLSLLTLVGGITMTVSSYLIFYNEQFFDLLNKCGALNIFRFKKDDPKGESHKEASIVLFGCHRMGKYLLKLTPRHKNDLLIIDFDPKTVAELKSQGYKAVYGDLADNGLYEAYGIESKKVIISSVPSLKENKNLLNYLKGLNTKPVIVIVGNDDEAAKQLYDYGTDFVIYPHSLGANILSDIVDKKAITKSIVQLRNKQIEALEYK